MLSYEENLASGREKLQAGDYAGALTHADAALALQADSFEALQLRGRALYLLGRDVEALQTLRRAHAILHKLAPLSRRRDEFTEDEDELALPEPIVFDDHVGPPPEALETLETLLSLRERYHLDDDLLALLAELAEDAGRYTIAAEAFQALVNDNPDNLDAWEGLLHVTCHQDLDATLALVNRALARHPRHALFYEYLGFVYSRRRRYRQALSAYRQAMELGADHPDNYESVVQCYLDLGEIDTAVAVTHRLIEHNPNDVESHRFALDVGLQCEDFDMALHHAHQLVRLEPTHADTYCDKARVELAMDEPEAAERTLILGFHKVEDGIFALLDLVDDLIADDEFDQALRVAELAGRLAPDHPESHAARGKALRELGMLDDAYHAFNHAATLAPQDDAYQTWLGIVLDNQGEYFSAVRQFTRVLARHPDDVWTLSNRGYSQIALGLFDQAMADLTRCIELDPEDAPLFFWRACACVQRDEHDPALADLRRALDLSDDILPWLEEEASLDPLRDDPRFRELLQPGEPY